MKGDRIDPLVLHPMPRDRVIDHWMRQIAFYTRCIMECGVPRTPRGRKPDTTSTSFATPAGVAYLRMTHPSGHAIGDVWDQSTIDGVHVGNRCGAIDALARRIVCELLPEIGIVATRSSEDWKTPR